jgi:hypothetical protein
VPRAARDKPMASRLERDCTSREDAGHDNRLAIRRLVPAAVQPPDAAFTLKDECRKPANPSEDTGDAGFGVCGRIKPFGMIARLTVRLHSGTRVELPAQSRSLRLMCTRAANSGFC